MAFFAGHPAHSSNTNAVRNDVIVLCWETPTSSEINALKIAEFSGANVRYVSLAPSESHTPIRELLPACVCLIVHVETLVRIADLMGAADGLLVLSQLAEHIFVFGFQPTDRHLLMLQELSSHELVGWELTSAGDDRFHVTDGQRAWCAQFSGLSFGTVNSKRDGSFLQSAEGSHLTVLIRAGCRPFFVRTRLGSSEVHLSACAELADLDESVRFDASALSWFSRLVPLMMFLRAALRERLWHSNTPRACFIVDDPLLRNQYGFLDYRTLSRTMRGQKFSLCVAFIPWNFRRSQGRVRELFSGDSGMYSVCIHGCDHTAAEFESADFQSVSAKASLALERMQAHRMMTGIPFHEVMVFPQGLFTSEALDALNACGYLAAVNSHSCPSNMRGTLILRDLLDVALTKFDFPLFGRRYPDDNVADFAFDLFLGKPALAVEHHRYFRKGYGALEAFVAALNTLDSKLEWTDLTTICSRACLAKRLDDGDTHMRFYTRRFCFTNTGTQRNSYILSRKRTRVPVPSVTLNGQQWRWEVEGDDLKMAISLDVGRSAAVEINSIASTVAAASSQFTGVQNVRVHARRLMCEFRDNYVHTNTLLNGVASGLRQLGSAATAATAHVRSLKAAGRQTR